jgi:hypothetical protein
MKRKSVFQGKTTKAPTPAKPLDDDRNPYIDPPSPDAPVPQWTSTCVAGPVRNSVLNYAKASYFLDVPFQKVNRECGIPRDEWDKQIERGWKAEKAQYDKVLENQAETILTYGAELVTRQLKRWHEENTPMDVKDTKLLADIIGNIHKIRQLELGKATSITQVESMTPKQLSEVFDAAKEEIAEFIDVLPASLRPRDGADRSEE